MVFDFIQQKAGGVAATAPIMGGAPTVSNIGTSTADLTGTYTSDGGSPITGTGFVVYPSGNPSTIIGGANVLQFADAALPSPINATATNLTPTTNYCFKPYAINALGTSYGIEVCFTTMPIGYVTNYGANNVSKIDLTSFSTLSSFSIASGPLSGAIADGYMYCGGLTNNLDKIYLGYNSYITLALGGQASDLKVSGGFVYVTVSGNSIKKIDIATFSVVATITLVGAQGIVIVGGFAYVSNQGGGTIYKIDLSTFTLISTTAVLSGMSLHRIDSDGTFLYVTDYIGGKLIKVSISTFTEVGSYSGLSTPYGVICNGGFAYVGNNALGKISKIDTSTMSLVGNVTVGNGPRYAGIKNGFLYMPCENSGNLHKINLSTFTNVGNISTGSGAATFLVG